jgi:hypothetical protein
MRAWISVREWLAMKLMSADGALGRIDWIGLAAWAVFLILFFNVLAFVIHCANPVLMSDDWYFLDVFVRKAIDGDLHFADFFVKRIGPDHSEPLIKMILLWCLRDFDLDISFEAFIGVLIALAYVLLFRFLIFSESKTGTEWTRHVAWVAICAIIFSLNGTEIWAWALNSAQYSSAFLMPVFMWLVWRAYDRQQYLLLTGVTLLFAFVSDDNAIICIGVTLVALAFHALFRKKGEKKRVLLCIFATVLVSTLIIRIGYLYAPLVWGAKDMALTDKLHSLFGQVRTGQWLKWIETPMIWSVASRSFLPPGHDRLFEILEYGILAVMLLLQCWFWVRAFRHEWNLLVFVAICLMLVTYGWIAGVLLYRIAEYGADYFRQDRYVRLYQFDLVALVLMWAGSIPVSTSETGKKRLIGWGAIACLAFLVLQIPMSVTAWASVPYRQRYDQNLARQIYRLASNPSDSQELGNCDTQLPVCTRPLEQREASLKLLRDNHLNIFSPKVLLAHPYLLNATSALDAADRERLLSAVRDAEDQKSVWDVYGSIRSLFFRSDDRWPWSGLDVNALSDNDVPMLFQGCWEPDGERHHASSWCGPDVSLVLHKPAEPSSLTIEGWLPWTALYAKAGQVSSVTLTVAVNDVVVAKKAFNTDEAFSISVPERDLATSANRSGPMYIRISADSSVVPSRFPPSQDSRDLSMKLSSVYFSPAAKGMQ